MANTSGINITGNLTLNPQSINAASKQVQQALGRITGQASEFQKSLDASTARVFAFGATTSILNGVSQAFKGLIANTINVEKRLTEIGTIIGSTGSQLNDFRNTIFDVAKTTGQSFNVVADAASELARQGLNAEETAKRLESALVLTRISGLDSVKSVKALTAAINGFSSAGLTAEQITNKLVAVDTAFAVSAQDLAEAFSRAGSTAEDAGVSFDELLGIVTAVEQTTSRGGAVIGNALKSIFTRLGRGSVVEDLRELGVEINSSQSGVQKLQALSQSLENISDPTVANKIKELAGGVYQINIVSAALKDLGSDTSIFSQAASKSASAMDEAFTKNAALNETISSQMNALVVGLTNLSEKIGTITFGPIIKNLLSLANEFTSFLETAFDPEKGNKFIQGIFDAIGNFLSGPGLVLITTGFLKIFSLVAKFAKEGFKTVLQIGSESEKIKNIESGIVGLLSRDQQLRAIIASSTATQAQKEQAVINAIKAENDLLRQQEQLLRSIATAAAQRGVVGYSPDKGFAGKGKKTFAAGFMVEEAQARMLGASPNVKAKMSKGKIGGQKFIMNNEEIEIPKFGKNGDSAVIPMYNKGYIPNFAKYIYDSDRITPDKGATLKAVLASQVKKNLIIGPAGSGKSTLAGKMGKFLSNADDVSNATEIDILSGAARAKGGGISKNLEAIISAVNGSDGKVSYLYAKNLDILSRRAGRTVAEEGDLRSKKQLKGTTYAPLNQFDFMGYVKSKSRNFNLINAAKGFIPNFQNRTLPLLQDQAILRQLAADPNSGLDPTKTQLRTSQVVTYNGQQYAVPASKLKNALEVGDKQKKVIDVASVIGTKMPTMLTPNDNSKDVTYTQNLKDSGVKLKYVFDAFKAGTTDELRQNFEKNFGETEIEEVARKFILNQSQVLAKALDLKPAEPDSVKEVMGGEGFKGAIRSASGSLFEAAINSTLQYKASNPASGGNFDIRTAGATSQQINSIKKLFGEDSIVSSGLADFKYSAETNKESMAAKVKKEYSAKINDAISKSISKKNKATGYIPNFADPLKEAIGREMSAGVPASQIYVDQNSSLKNSMNPMGLMVANRRDEPAGGIQGISRARKEGANPKLYGAARGFIPNYAAKAPDDIDGKVKFSLEKFSGAAIALSMTLSSIPSLIGPTEELDSSMTSTAKIITSSAAQFASIGSVFGPIGTAVGAAAGMVMSVVDAYKDVKNKQEEGVKIQEEVNKKLKGLTAVRKGRQEAFGSNTNKDAAFAQQDLIKALKDRSMSIKPLQDAESNLKKIYEEQTSTEEDKNEASFQYIQAIKRAQNSLDNIDFTKDFAKKIQESAAKFSKTLDLVSTKLEQQSFLEGIAGGFTAKEGSKYSGAVKSATETQQSVTQSTKSAVDFRGNFASSDFASMMNQVKQSQLSGKTGAEISGTVSADVFKAYMEKGAQGVTQELSKYINVQSAAGEKFKDNVISSAETFRNNVAETMQQMDNQKTDLENKLITTNKEIQSKITSSISGITEKLSSITQGPKIDPLAISTAFSEAAKISATNPEEADKIIARVSEQFVKFREIFGEEAARKLAESSGLGLKETQNLTAGVAASQINYKPIEDALRKSLGSIPLDIQKAMQAAKLDVKNVPALQKLIDEKMQGSRFDQSRKTIQAALTGVAAGKPDENKDDIKKLEEERNRTSLELKNLNERIAKFSEDFKPTGIPQAMIALSESISNASDNVKGFQEFTGNLNRLSTTVNQRLLDIERRLSQVN
jgi:TP901 family phage tail tape measure protein